MKFQVLEIVWLQTRKANFLLRECTLLALDQDKKRSLTQYQAKLTRRPHLEHLDRQPYCRYSFELRRKEPGGGNAANPARSERKQR